MRVNEQCAACLLDKQMHKTDDPEYLNTVRTIIAGRREEDTSPYLVYLFNQAYEQRFGKAEPYKQLKQQFNDLVLDLESQIRSLIETAADPLAASLAFARTGNYIDFGAMNHVDEDTFLSLLSESRLAERDLPAYSSFVKACSTEIVLDKLFLEQLHRCFPHLQLTVMVRGSEVLNDATPDDARYVRLHELADVISNGTSVAGTIYEMLPDNARQAIDRADVILAKGQGNYESMCGRGIHAFYSLLCKCDLFTERFQVPKLTGIFVEE